MVRKLAKSSEELDRARVAAGETVAVHVVQLDPRQIAQVGDAVLAAHAGARGLAGHRAGLEQRGLRAVDPLDGAQLLLDVVRLGLELVKVLGEASKRAEVVCYHALARLPTRTDGPTG